LARSAMNYLLYYTQYMQMCQKPGGNVSKVQTKNSTNNEKIKY